MSLRRSDMEVLLIDGTTKPAEELKVGDKVDTLHQNTMKRGEHEVTYVRVIESPLLQLTLSGKKLKCSEEDVFYSKARKGWLKATELVEGDTISQLDGEVEFQGSEKLGKGQSVELTIDDAHTYVCDGVLFHNKGGGAAPAPPKPVTYSQDEVDAMKTDWQTKADAGYDTRLAGQQELWAANAAKDRAEWQLAREGEYHTKLGDARSEWQTAADERYNQRLGSAKQDWHTTADANYQTQLGNEKAAWDQAQQEKIAGINTGWEDKYGGLQSEYGGLQDKYDKQREAHVSAQDDWRKTKDRVHMLEGNYGELTEKYQNRGRDFDNLRNQYDTDKNKWHGERRKNRQSDFRDREWTPDVQPRQPRQPKQPIRGGYSEGDGYSGSGSGRNLSSDAERMAKLTGDYSFLETDAAKSRREKQEQDNIGRKYIANFLGEYGGENR